MILKKGLVWADAKAGLAISTVANFCTVGLDLYVEHVSLTEAGASSATFHALTAVDGFVSGGVAVGLIIYELTKWVRSKDGTMDGRVVALKCTEHIGAMGASCGAIYAGHIVGGILGGLAGPGAPAAVPALSIICGFLFGLLSSLATR